LALLVYFPPSAATALPPGDGVPSHRRSRPRHHQMLGRGSEHRQPATGRTADVTAAAFTSPPPSANAALAGETVTRRFLTVG